MFHSMHNFQENERDSRTLKKIHELVHHFCEQCKHYVKLEEINYNKEKIEGEKLYKSETNLYKMWCGFIVCKTIPEKMLWLFAKRTYG